jgi:hypothetical protein
LSVPPCLSLISVTRAEGSPAPAETPNPFPQGSARYGDACYRDRRSQAAQDRPRQRRERTAALFAARAGSDRFRLAARLPFAASGRRVGRAFRGLCSELSGEWMQRLVEADPAAAR